MKATPQHTWVASIKVKYKSPEKLGHNVIMFNCSNGGNTCDKQLMNSELEDIHTYVCSCLCPSFHLSVERQGNNS